MCGVCLGSVSKPAPHLRLTKLGKIIGREIVRVLLLRKTKLREIK